MKSLHMGNTNGVAIVLIKELRQRNARAHKVKAERE